MDLLGVALKPLIAQLDAAAYLADAHEPLRSGEEIVYHRLLTDAYSRPQVLLPNVARWVDNRLHS